MTRPIKFEFVGRNKALNEIVKESYTLEEIISGLNIATFFDRRNDNCKLLARRQFTGLTDKNGKEIYEGDIVKGAEHWDEANSDMHFDYGVVVWLDWDARFSAMQEEYLKVPECSNIGGPNLTEKDIEVIGNIYENPELLK